MKFSSSRIFPGQDQLTRARIVSDGIFYLPIHFLSVFRVKCSARDGMSSG